MTAQSRSRTDKARAEMNRLLMKLAESGAYGSLLADLPADAEKCVAIWSPHNDFKAPVARFSRAAYTSLLENDLISPEADGARFTLSPAGRSALRRALARNEPFREQHEIRAERRIQFEGGVQAKATVNEAESPLAWLRSRRDRSGQPLIDDVQFRAGERLRADFTLAQMTPRVTAVWGSVASSRRERRGSPKHAESLTESALAARQRVEQALEAVGPDFAGVLLDVCCFLHGIEAAEKRGGFPQRSGKVVLKLALNALARHYGMLGTGDFRSRRQPIHWGSADYRPTIDGGARNGS